jgi:hypothetical protein
MATLYYNGEVSSDWNEILNWWKNDTFSIQATSLPNSGDNVVISESVNGDTQTVLNLVAIGNSLINITITVTGVATFNDFSSVNPNLPVYGDAIFNDYSYNNNQTFGDCVFNDYSYNNNQIFGDCVFNDYSYNYGTISGDAIFNDYSYNREGATISGDAIFNDYSYNDGTIYGEYIYFETYEFNFSPDAPNTQYNTEGGLDVSTFIEDNRIISAQRTGYIEIDSGKVVLVKDGAEKKLRTDIIRKLDKPHPISQVLNYTQSSVWGSLQYADAKNMTNGIYQESKGTGTSDSNFEWVQVDLNGVFNIKGVVIGCDWDDSLEGGWGKVFSENCDVQCSLDGKNWEFIFNTEIFEKPIQIFPAKITARYIRIIASSYNANYLAVTEFYAI